MHRRRAAIAGAIETMLADIDEIIPGRIGEIASRALAADGRVIAVRKADIPGGEALAAILR